MSVKLFTYITLILVISFSCKNNETKKSITGDLYFGFFRLGSYYNQPDSIIDKFRSYFDTLDYKTASADDKQFMDLYKIVVDKNLIYKSYVDILVQPDSIVKLYLDSTDYNKIKIHKRKDLQDNNKKIVINAMVTDYTSGIFYCDSLISIEKVDGQTLQIQKKFRIDDYE